MSKRIAIMQPYIFPYIGYFQLVNFVEKFIFYDDVTYIKQGWINRNKIMINNQEYLFTIPLSNASSFQLISDVKISHHLHHKMRGKLYKSIQQAYGKSPYFSEVYNLIKNTLELKTDSISEMAQQSIKSICKYLDIDTEFLSSKNVYDNEDLNGQNRVIDIVVKEKANHYVNPIGGAILYDSEAFKEKNIELSFLTVDKYLKNRLIIDILMNFNKEEIKNILNQYIIVK